VSEVRQLDLPASKKLVLILMADNANDEGTRCFPSIRRLAYETGYSTRTVIRIIKDLSEKNVKGEQVVELIQRGNQLTPNQYKLNPSAGKKLAPFKPSRWAGKPASDKMSHAQERPEQVTSMQEQVTSATVVGDIPNNITVREPSAEPSVSTVSKQRTPSSSANWRCSDARCGYSNLPDQKRCYSCGKPR
jgi:Helix-turn-helix domain